jgi:hypothetical protein
MKIFGKFYGQLVYLIDIWYTFWTFGIFWVVWCFSFLILVYYTKENLATLLQRPLLQRMLCKKYISETFKKIDAALQSCGVTTPASQGHQTQQL